MSIRFTMSKRNNVCSALVFCLLLTAFGFIAGFDLLCASLLAAILHEGGHLAVLWLFGAREGRLLVHASGLEWRSDGRRLLSYGREILCVLAGPAANVFFALVFARLASGGRPFLYAWAGAQLMMGAFNLLPVLPLDGGRAVELLLSRLTDPFWAWRVMSFLSLVCSVTFLIFATVLFLNGGGAFLLFGALTLFCLTLRELGLVKR